MARRRRIQSRQPAPPWAVLFVALFIGIIITAALIPKPKSPPIPPTALEWMISWGTNCQLQKLTAGDGKIPDGRYQFRFVVLNSGDCILRLPRGVAYSILQSNSEPSITQEGQYTRLSGIERFEVTFQFPPP